ncbi:MAG: MFS transporter [Lachnospiraceae bacterium]|nr:MFS transporter [Lachnospiraceae bacterium]
MLLSSSGAGRVAAEDTKNHLHSGKHFPHPHPTYHWLVIICCCAIAGTTVGFFNSAYGTFYTSLSEKFHTGRASVSLHATISLLVTAFSAPFAVKLVHKFGVRPILIFSLVLQDLSLLLIIPATSLWQLNALGVMRGIGGGFMHVPIITVILNNWYLDHVGISMGLIFSMASGFGALFSWLISVIIEKTNYQVALIVCAVLVFLLILPSLIFLHLQPEEIGLHPHGWRKNETPARQNAPSGEIKKPERKPFYRIPDFYCLCLFALLTVPIVALQMHFSGFCELIGAGSMFGGIMMSTVMIGSVFFKLVVGEILDLLGAFRMMAIVLAVDVSSLLLIFANRTYTGNGLSLLIGAFFFGIHASIGSIGIAGVSRAVMGPEDDGTAFSIVSGCASGGAALSITLIAMIFDATGTYNAAFIGGISMLLAGGILLFILWRRKRNRMY